MHHSLPTLVIPAQGFRKRLRPFFRSDRCSDPRCRKAFRGRNRRLAIHRRTRARGSERLQFSLLHANGHQSRRKRDQVSRTAGERNHRSRREANPMMPLMRTLNGLALMVFRRQILAWTRRQGFEATKSICLVPHRDSPCLPVSITASETKCKTGRNAMTQEVKRPQTSTS